MMISKEARNTSEGQPNIAHLDEFLGPCKKIENYFIVSHIFQIFSRQILNAMEMAMKGTDKNLYLELIIE